MPPTRDLALAEHYPVRDAPRPDLGHRYDGGTCVRCGCLDLSPAATFPCLATEEDPTDA